MVGLVLVVWGSRLGRAAFLVGALPPAVSVILVYWRLGDITAGRVVADRATWVVGLGLSLDLRLDGLAATMTLIVAGVGVLVMVYAASYFPAGSPDLGRLAGLLVLFAGAMVGLVQADHLAKASTLGAVLLFAGATINLPDVNDTTSVALAAVLHVLTSPPASNMLSRATYLAYGMPSSSGTIDEGSARLRSRT